MTLTTHAATGMLVAQYTSSPLLGFLAAMMSHYILDAIPHGDEFIYWRQMHHPKDPFAITVAVFDTLGSIAILLGVLQLAPQYTPMIMVVGAIGGVLPDVLMTIYSQTKRIHQEHPAGLQARTQDFFQRLLHIHYSFHMLFHDLMRTPIRFRTSVFLQLIYLVLFFQYFVLG